MNIFVGNLSPEVNEQDIMSLFSQIGQVKEVKIIRDMFSRQSRGFAFVEMPGNAEAQKAINELNTRELKGKKIVVNEAKPRRDNKKRGGGRFQGGKHRF
ncbi:MAG: RNA-binding protein [Ignavibacteriaceae bacterium]